MASTSRVVAFLDREALLTRGQSGDVLETNWVDLLRRWTQDYSFATSNRVTAYLESRGLDALVRKLVSLPPSDLGDERLSRHSEDDVPPYAVTGSLVAVRVAPIAPTRSVTVYTIDPQSLAQTLQLKQAERGANVLLAEPFDSVVFARTTRLDGLLAVGYSQVAVDLLTGTGRQPAEGEHLLQWMATHEDSWRV